MAGIDMNKSKRSKLLIGAAAAVLVALQLLLPATGDIGVITSSQLATTSTNPPPCPIGPGPGYSGSQGYISFSSLNSSNVSVSVSAEILIVDLLNTLVVAPVSNGSLYIAYLLPVGVTMYVSSSLQSSVSGVTSLAGTALAGTGSVEVSAGFAVVSQEHLYISFVMDGNTAATGFIQTDFAP